MRGRRKKLIIWMLAILVGFACTPNSVHAEDSQTDGTTEPSTSSEVKIDDAFPDERLRAIIKQKFDTDGEGTLSQSEIENAKTLNVYNESTIRDMSGIEYLTSLTYLNCTSTSISELDVSGNKNLEELYCESTSISELNLSNNKELKKLECGSTNIQTLDVSSNTALEKLYCWYTDIKELDVTNNPNLKTLVLRKTKVTSLNLRNNSLLERLECNECSELTGLDLTNNPNLTFIDCSDTKVSSIDVSQMKNLETLYCYNTAIRGLDVTMCSKLKRVYCYGSSIAYANIGDNRATGFDCRVWMGDTEGIDINAEDLENGSLNLSKAFPGIDTDRVSNVTNAELKDGVISGFSADTPVTYLYNCGGNWTPWPTSMRVTLRFNISQNRWTTPLSMEGWTYGEAAKIPAAEAAYGDDVVFTYSDQPDGKFTTAVPEDAGTWYVKASVTETDNYTGLEAVKEFTIAQATNDWTEKLSIKGWTIGQYDKKENVPVASALFGKAIFTYSQDKDGEFTSDIPKEAGTWYVKAVVAETGNYTGLEAVQEFTVSKSDTAQNPDDETSGKGDSGKTEDGTDENNTDKDRSSRSAVKTGDTSNIFMWGVAAVVSVFGIAVAGIKRRKRSN